MRQPGLIRSRNETDQYVPTYAYPSFVADLVNTLEIVNTGFEGLNACFIDRAAGEALARVVSGPITTKADLEAAEAALQAIVFHDHISIISPAVMNKTAMGESVYRFDAAQSEALRAVFATLDVSDELVIVEHVTTQDAVITQTNLSNEIVGTSLDAVSADYMHRRPLSGATLSQLASEYRLPAYFAAPDVQQYFGDRGFSGLLYSTVGINLVERISVVPGSDVEVALPFLLWALLDRATKREDIPKAIGELRDLTSQARQELRDLDGRMKTLSRQAQREDVARHYRQAFDAVVKAAHQSNVTTVQRSIYSLIEFTRKPYDAIASRLNPDWKPSDPRVLVKRSLAATAFSDLIAKDSTQVLIEAFFSKAEQKALENEARGKLRSAI